MSNGNGGMMGDVTAWLAKPFNPEGDVLDWVLWIGVLVVAWWFWNTVLLLLVPKV